MVKEQQVQYTRSVCLGLLGGTTGEGDNAGPVQ